MSFTPKKFTTLKDEIYSEKKSMDNSTKVTLIIILCLLGFLYYLNTTYVENNREELINLRVMNQ